MWRISLLYEVVANIIPYYSDGAMIPELLSMPITEGFSNDIYECETTGQLIQFYYAKMGYPCTSTWCKAITALYFIGWTGLTATLVYCFINVVEETEIGHMYQQQQSTRSTKPVPINPDTIE